MEKQVRVILQELSGLGDDVADVSANEDLWRLGMTSLASVEVMLALEAAFGFEFPESKLSHATFSCISNIIGCITELTGGASQ
jgi:acyl carrier protein